MSAVYRAQMCLASPPSPCELIYNRMTCKSHKRMALSNVRAESSSTTSPLLSHSGSWISLPFLLDPYELSLESCLPYELGHVPSPEWKSWMEGMAVLILGSCVNTVRAQKQGFRPRSP
uniref:Uncharacterized protein n=2 Tax=Populus alba TaxID=43335 RepID=A0A4U5QZ75_POPAL|nr:hypothetical protein D5086_0000021820 [Populus alba]